MARSKFLFLLVWLPMAYLQLGPFRLRDTDTWTYFAPAAFARYPLDLTLPLLGNWWGADQTWALHWPGPQIVFSFFTPFLPVSSVIYAGLFLGVWVGVAQGSALLSKRITGSAFFAFCTFAWVLLDRCLFETLLFMRGDSVAALVLLGFLVAWYDCLEGKPRSKVAAILLVFCSGLLPLMHPLSVALSVVLLGGMGVMLFEERRKARVVEPTLQGRNRWGSWLWLSVLGAHLLGFALMGAWLLFKPMAWAQFIDHAQQNRVPYSFGKTFFSAMRPYFPTYFMGVLTLLALGESMRQGRLIWKEKKEELKFSARRFPCFLGLLLVGGLIAHQAFHGYYYFTVLMPLIVVLAMAWLSHFSREWTLASQRCGAWMLLGALAIHGLFLPMRTFLYFQTGRPDLGAITRQFLDTLPSEKAALILTSPLTWEYCLTHWKNRPVYLITPTYSVSSKRKREYEEALYAQLQPGDLIILSRVIPDLLKEELEDPLQWKVVGQMQYHTPGTESHRFRFQAYQKQ